MLKPNIEGLEAALRATPAAKMLRRVVTRRPGPLRYLDHVAGWKVKRREYSQARNTWELFERRVVTGAPR